MSDLTNIWSKSSCLSKTQMLQYLQQKLEKEEIYVVESHLNDCPFCSDAIDGLINEDVAQTESNLSDLKIDFEKKIHSFDEEQKIIKQAELAKKTTPKEESNIKPFVPKRSNRQWIWAAASLFFIIGLGYSVFSFIQQYAPKNQHVAKNIESKVSPSNPNYNLSESDNTSELIHIEVNPNDLPMPQTEVIKSKEAKSESKFVPPLPTKIVQEKEYSIADKKATETVAKVNEKATASIPVQEYNAPVEPTKAALVKESEPGMSNFARDEVEYTAKEKLGKSKKSNVGLSKNATPTSVSPSANQMNYSSSPNYDNNAQEDIAAIQSSKNKDTYKEPEASALSIALNNYANRNYRKAARQLEKILPSATGNAKEEIVYHLAMCNKNLHKEEAAKTYFSQLVKSKKYGKLAQSAILEYSKDVKK